MLLFFIKIFFVVLFVLCFAYAFFNPPKGKLFSVKAIILSVIPAILFIVSSAFYIVPANSVGIVWSKINGLQKQPLSEGLNMIRPIVDDVIILDATVQKSKIKNVCVQTKDSQYVTMEGNIKYRVTDFFKVYQNYRTLENLKTNLINDGFLNALNDVYSEYNVIPAIGSQQPEIRNKTKVALEKIYAKAGVELLDITFEDVDAGEEIEKAITQEGVAKKAVETAKQEKEKAEIEAERKLIEAKGEAEANKVKTQELTKEILQEQWIQKWNGELPDALGPDNMFVGLQ